MWKCKKCSEKIEDEFDICWNCGADKEGAVSDKDVVAQIKTAKIEQKQERIEEKKNQVSVRKISENEVVIVDIQIPFWSMVVLMVKSAFAAIPAMVIVMFVAAIFFGIFGGIFMR